jgi:hypothetical protein
MGRWRSNVWTYPGAPSLGSDARRGPKDYPKVKPTAVLGDALLDITNRGDVVTDPFLRSGSMFIATDNTGRVCRGVQLDPFYVDVVIRRSEYTTGATLAGADGTRGFIRVRLISARAGMIASVVVLARRTWPEAPPSNHSMGCSI